ncbi:unnamed protein product [Allacma fusca]|uniref:CCHC-type domain-containing protein n=1 Tax=Allacma fusca TaxID=39272 RepID=A0A8J2PML3_9HEXA|nr:unnamed protein product [Allacma fusca]
MGKCASENLDIPSSGGSTQGQNDNLRVKNTTGKFTKDRFLPRIGEIHEEGLIQPAHDAQQDETDPDHRNITNTASPGKRERHLPKKKNNSTDFRTETSGTESTKTRNQVREEPQGDSENVNKQTTALLLSRLKTWELEDQESGGNSKTSESGKAFTVQKQNGKKPKRTKEEIAKLKKKTKCHFCTNQGHWARECPDKKKNNDSKQTTTTSQLKSGGTAYAAGVLDEEWVNDCAADAHYCGRLEWFSEYAKYSEPQQIRLANGSYMQTLGIGNVKVSTPSGHNGSQRSYPTETKGQEAETPLSIHAIGNDPTAGEYSLK